eukprot:12923411-Prorocentrum_lima.AAC.1
MSRLQLQIILTSRWWRTRRMRTRPWKGAQMLKTRPAGVAVALHLLPLAAQAPALPLLPLA